MTMFHLSDTKKPRQHAKQLKRFLAPAGYGVPLTDCQKWWLSAVSSARQPGHNPQAKTPIATIARMWSSRRSDA